MSFNSGVADALALPLTMADASAEEETRFHSREALEESRLLKWASATLAALYQDWRSLSYLEYMLNTEF